MIAENQVTSINRIAFEESCDEKEQLILWDAFVESLVCLFCLDKTLRRLRMFAQTKFLVSVKVAELGASNSPQMKSYTFCGIMLLMRNIFTSIS